MKNENNNLKLTTTAFVSTDLSENRRAYARVTAVTNPTRSRRCFDEKAVFLAVRLCLCVLCFATVLVLKLVNTPDAEAVLNSISVALNEEGEYEEELGRLKFVQLPSIIEVFAPSDKPILPAEILSSELLEDETRLKIVTVGGSEVLCVNDAKVTEIGSDDVYGKYVSLRQENDIVVVYYGLDNICVELNQPVSQRSPIAIVESSELIVMVYDKGRPINPLTYFGIEVA